MRTAVLKAFFCGVLGIGLLNAQPAPLDTICIFDPPSHLEVQACQHCRYEWNVGSAQIISAPDSNAIEVDWRNASQGILKVWTVAIDTINGCPGDTSFASLLINSPELASGKAPQEVCRGQWVTLESTMPTGTYQWQGGKRSRYVDFQAKRDTSVNLVALNPGCDNDTMQFNIKVFPQPEAGIMALPDTVILGESVNLFFNGRAPASKQIDWYLENNWQSMGNAVKLDFQKTGYHEVTQIVTSGDCSDTLHRKIYVDDEFTAFFPNSFTPNGDGNNEYWFFKGAGHEEFEAAIYNRWGEQLFSWTHREKVPGWDGNNRGEKADIGSYIYKVSITDTRGEVHFFQGHFSLIR